MVKAGAEKVRFMVGQRQKLRGLVSVTFLTFDFC